MPRINTSVRIVGTEHGTMWMPNAHGWMPVEAVEYRNGPRQRIIDSSDPSYRTDLRAMVESVLTGDFQDATLTPETFVIVRRERATSTGNVVRERIMGIDRFPSVADYVSDCDGHYTDD